MKKKTLILMFVLILLVLTPILTSVLFAQEVVLNNNNFWKGLFQSIFTWENLGSILALIFAGILAIVSAKFKALWMEVSQAVEKLVKAKQKDSPGGTVVTVEEWKGVVDEVIDVLKEAMNIWARGFMKPIALIFGLFKKKKG